MVLKNNILIGKKMEFVVIEKEIKTTWLQCPSCKTAHGDKWMEYIALVPIQDAKTKNINDVIMLCKDCLHAEKVPYQEYLKAVGLA